MILLALQVPGYLVNSMRINIILNEWFVKHLIVQSARFSIIINCAQSIQIDLNFHSARSDMSQISPHWRSCYRLHHVHIYIIDIIHTFHVRNQFHMSPLPFTWSISAIYIPPTSTLTVSLPYQRICQQMLATKCIFRYASLKSYRNIDTDFYLFIAFQFHMELYCI